MTAASLDLFAGDGTTIIAGNEPSDFGESTQIIWKSDRDDQVYLRARHLDDAVAGNIVSYRLSVNEQLQVFLPLVNQ